MAKVTNYKGAAPYQLFTVESVTDGHYRVYVSEAQALRWFQKLLDEGKEVKICSYSDPNTVGAGNYKKKEDSK